MSGMKRNEKTIRQALQVYFIMGSDNCIRNPVQVLTEAIEGGITLFQFREKGTGALQGEAKAELAWQLRQLCRRHGVPFIVNDDVDLAMAVDADGVHVGQEDEAAAAVRRRIGGRLLGVSAYNREEAEEAIRCGADYVGVGPLYATRTKEDAKAATGPGVIADLRQLGLRIPIVGIGGITERNAGEVVRAGADGVSVITAISHAEHPRAAATALLRAVRTAGGEEGDRHG